MFLTIPTLLTWARIAAIPLIIGVYYLGWDTSTKNLVATSMFVLFAATDWLDGYLARKLNQTSAFGAFLDPVADKFLICASLLVLLEHGRVDSIVALIIIGREIAISALREWMAHIGASRSVAAVSYTHLDVYKRQSLRRPTPSPAPAPARGARTWRTTSSACARWRRSPPHSLA